MTAHDFSFRVAAQSGLCAVTDRAYSHLLAFGAFEYMRIIAGTFRSRQLKGTPPAGLRPTSDKLRGTLFNILGPIIEGSDFLDACAGMGGVGIEAISRGAHLVYFIESTRKASTMIRDNLASLDIRSNYRVLEMELNKAFRMLEREAAGFDIVFLDPPYDREDLYTMTLDALAAGTLLKEAGILVMEHSKRYEPPAAVQSLRCYRTLIQGDSGLSFYRKNA